MKSYTATESLYLYLDSSLAPQYSVALRNEIEIWASLKTARSLIKTVFIGTNPVGLYPYGLVLDTAAILRSTCEFDPQAEITLEVYPGTSIIDVARAGITRININTSYEQCTVASVAKVLESVSAELCVSIDVIASPDNQEHWKEFIMQVALLPLHHISITFEPRFELYRWTVQALADEGYGQYEMMNFARQGYESKHNLAYWQRKPYKGFGLGANSFERNIRTQNTRDKAQYCSASNPVLFKEAVTTEQELTEILMLGLPQIAGIAWEALEPYNLDRQRIQDLVAHGYARYTQGGFALTHEGFGVIDEIICKII